MLLLIVIAFLIAAGALRWTPWAPVYAALVGALSFVFAFANQSAWRHEAGLSQRSLLDYIPFYLVSVALYFGIYWISRWISNALRRPE